MRLKLTGIGALAASIALVMAACSSQTEPARDVATTPTTSASACVVGEPGPGGGTIFYRDAATGLCFEAAPSGWNGGGSDPSLAWGTTNKCASISIATGTAIGDGEANTTAITRNTACDTPKKAPAAWAAKNYAGGGRSDWFLPSKDELNQLYAQKTTVGGFAGVLVWSSSQNGASYAWWQNLGAGGQISDYKGLTLRVRPVRAF
ncbi:MAG: DUF1566 domain-containing protein [Candidatus Nanopelagicales bacterium]|nr:DUF1566 domain-containing protein [Candidatus Nanopelagicales bacterium]MDZ4250574.1 DUF1566 domain-containing protein [Candidatus Nanopelagicales bacterium]